MKARGRGGAHEWFLDGPGRRKRRRVLAYVLFTAMLGGFALWFGLSTPDQSPSVDVFIAVIVGGIAGILVYSAGRGDLPTYVTKFAARHRFSVTPNSLMAFTPVLQQPFGRTHGSVKAALPDGTPCALGAYDYVRPIRWYASMFFRVLFQEFGSPKATKLVSTLVRVPETRDLLPVLLCERRFGPQLPNSVEDAARRLTRIETESAALTEIRELFVLDESDHRWAKRLFSPSFVRWHAEEGGDVAWELVDGWLCVTIERKADTEYELQRALDVGAHVFERLREEAEQTTSPPPDA
jgi:hypothetical protein